MSAASLTILHVEDDPALARLVKIVFRSFGFLGEIVSAGSVREAKALLHGQEAGQKPFSLILTDMNLPDGTGLDVIREARAIPAWHTTPLVVLSSEESDKVIGAAYALGANCYMPKVVGSHSPVDSLRSLYHCWLEVARLPRPGTMHRPLAGLEKTIELRTRTSEFYLGLAQVFHEQPEEMEFWLNCALSEGNLCSLAVFIRNKLDATDIAPATLDRLAIMQIQIEETLRNVEAQLQAPPAPDPATACQWALALADAVDEGVVAEALGSLFPVSPVATTAFKARAALQLQGLAMHILERVQEPELRQKAVLLRAGAERLLAAQAV